MEEQIITPQFLMRLLFRHFFTIVLSVALFVAVAVTVYLYMPKRYKARAALEIYASYFRQPLVSDLLSETHDPGELRSQRAALVRLALTPEFLNELGTAYGFYTPSSDPRVRALEHELLLKRIETFSISPTTFQISVAAGDPVSAQKLTQTVLDRIISTLVSERHEKLAGTRDALFQHVESLGAALNNLNTAEAAKSPELLRAELEKVNADIEALLRHYTKVHPDVASRIARAEELEKLVAAAPPPIPPAPGELEKPFLGEGAREPVKEVYHESLRKLSYLDIVLDLERDPARSPHFAVVEQPLLPFAPFFPNKKLLLLFGLVTGVIFAGVLVAFKEIRRGTFLSPELISDALGVPLLGRMPELDYKRKLRALTDPSKARLRLPLLAKEG